MSQSPDTMQGLLNGKHIAITGASRGIGRAIALLFAQEGGNLHLFSRNLDELETLSIELKKKGVAAHLFAGDVGMLLSRWSLQRALKNNFEPMCSVLSMSLSKQSS